MLDLNLKEGECLRRSLWGIVERMFVFVELERKDEGTIDCC